MVRTTPAGTLPPVPGSQAWAATSVHRDPAERTPAAVVSKRTPPADRHTVPWGMARSSPATVCREKRSVPAARWAGRRVIPRRKPCFSSSSPVAVWGKHWRQVQAFSSYRP